MSRGPETVRGVGDVAGAAGWLSDIGSVVAAELRLRLRHPGFWVIAALFVAFVWLALPPRSAGYAFMTAANKGGFRYDSSFIGMVVAFICTLLYGLAGFFFAHHSMRRDRITPAGEILAATPMTSSGYLWGKYLAAVSAMALLLGAALVTGIVVQLVRREAPLAPGALLSPVLLLAAPTLLYTAGLGTAAGALPQRGSGAGLNLVYVLYWLGCLWGSLSVAHIERGLWIGFTAFELPSFELARVYHASTILGVAPKASQLLSWQGLPAGLYFLPRLAYAALGPALVALSAAWFRRFDPAGGRRSRGS